MVCVIYYTISHVVSKKTRGLLPAPYSPYFLISLGENFSSLPFFKVHTTFLSIVLKVIAICRRWWGRLELTTCEQKAIIQSNFYIELKLFLLFFPFVLLIHGLSSAIHQRWSPSVWNFQFFSLTSYYSYLFSTFNFHLPHHHPSRCFVMKIVLLSMNGKRRV